MRGRSAAVMLVVAVSVVALAAVPAGASHIPSVFDCGAAGTFTSEGSDTPTGEEAPRGFTALFADTTKVLVALEVYADGQLVYTTPGIHRNNVDEATCTTTVNGVDFTVIGILT
jgi:hypothetical protein